MKKALTSGLVYDNCKDCIRKCEHAGKNREFVCAGGKTCKETQRKPITLDSIRSAIRYRISVKQSVLRAFKAEGKAEEVAQYTGEIQSLDELLLALSSAEDFEAYAGRSKEE